MGNKYAIIRGEIWNVKKKTVIKRRYYPSNPSIGGQGEEIKLEGGCGEPGEQATEVLPLGGAFGVGSIDVWPQTD